MQPTRFLNQNVRFNGNSVHVINTYVGPIHVKDCICPIVNNDMGVWYLVKREGFIQSFTHKKEWQKPFYAAWYILDNRIEMEFYLAELPARSVLKPLDYLKELVKQYEKDQEHSRIIHRHAKQA